MGHISDYFNNNMVHISRAVGDKQYKDRLSYISPKQAKVMLAHMVQEIVYKNPERFKYPLDVGEVLAGLVLDFSPSVNGKGISVLADIMSSRMPVEDIKDGKDKNNVDLEKT